MIWPDLNGAQVLRLKGSRVVNFAGRQARLLESGCRLEGKFKCLPAKARHIQLLDVRIWLMPVFPWRAEMLNATWNQEGRRFHEVWMPEVRNYGQYLESIKFRSDAEKRLSSPLWLELNGKVVRDEEIRLPGYFWPVWQMTIHTCLSDNTKLAILLPRLNTVSHPLAISDILVRPWSVKPLEILRCPEIVRTGRPFTVLVACIHGTIPIVTSLDAGLEYIGENSGVDSWTRELRFVAKRTNVNLKVNIDADGQKGQAVIGRVVDLPDDGLKVGIEMTDYSSIDIEKCLTWLHQEQLGNYAGLGFPYPVANGNIHVPIKSWQIWAERAQRDGIYFNNIYGEIPGKVRNLAGPYALPYQIHEVDGGLYFGWSDFSTKDVPKDLPDAQSKWLKYLKKTVPKGARMTGPSTTHRYFAQAGASWIGHEGLCTSLDIGLAHERGVARAYKLPEFGVHLAHQWYSYPHDDPAKIRRLRIALYMSYLYGAHNIYVENGTLRVIFQDRFEQDHPALKDCQDVHREFYRFVLAHYRTGEAEVNIGFIQGLYDSWTSYIDNHVWGQRGRGLAWEGGWPEQSWELLTSVYPLARLGALEMESDKPLHEPTGWFSTNPYGEVDLVPVEAPLEVLQDYKQLVFLGWNTMTKTTYDTLLQYVRNGGRLLLWLPHMTEQVCRDEPWRPFRGGGWEDLLGLSCSDYDLRPVRWIADETEVTAMESESGKLPVFRYNVKLSGARPLAWNSENKSPILTEYRLGHGIVYFVNLDCYPGFNGISAWARGLLTRLALESRPEVHVETDGSLHWVSYIEPNSGLRRVYILNIDWWSGSRRATHGWIVSGSWRIPVTVLPGRLVIVTMDDNVAVIPDEPQTYIESISRGRSVTKVIFQTGVRSMVSLFSRRGIPKKIEVKGTTCTARVEDGGCRVHVTDGGRLTLTFYL